MNGATMDSWTGRCWRWRNIEKCATARASLNHLYLANPQFHGSDCDPEGFRWLQLHNAD